MLFRTLDAILGTTTKVQMLRSLLPLDSPVTGREARRLAGVRSTVGAMTALNELTALGVLLRGGSPSTHQYRVNRTHEMEPALRALFDAERRRTEVLKGILNEVLTQAGVRASVRSVVLFGSQARQEARPDSDLDLLIIVDAPDRVAEVERAVTDSATEIWNRLGLRAAGIVVPADRARERLEEGDSLMEAIRAEGRSLLGEPFNDAVEQWSASAGRSGRIAPVHRGTTKSAERS
ncbi:MAG TPA: nucleotidyltransferase domain-containing protein [Longimicrobium sp.]|jgi:predicted nucleotidyltransferase